MHEPLRAVIEIQPGASAGPVNSATFNFAQGAATAGFTLPGNPASGPAAAGPLIVTGPITR